MRRFLAGLLVGVAISAVTAKADDDVPQLVTAAAVAHGVSPTWMLRIARCESSLDRYAVSGPNLGLFQLSRVGLLPEFYRRGYTDVWSPSEQSNFAAEILASGGARNWTCA